MSIGWMATVAVVFPKGAKSLSNHMKELKLNSTSGNNDVSLIQKEEKLKIL